jgi:hypothetical protein
MADRQRQFKRFNPDLKCCQCMCGKKYEVTADNTVFTVPNPGVTSFLVQDAPGAFAGLVLGKYSPTIRKEIRVIAENVRTITHPSGGTDLGRIRMSFVIGVGLVRVIVFKDGSFYIPQFPADFGDNYDEFPDDPLTQVEVLEGGGFHETQNEFLYFGEPTTLPEYIVPAAIDNACARWDLYTVRFYRGDMTGTATTFPPFFTIPSPLVGDSRILGYNSSVCRSEEVIKQFPPFFFDRIVGLYWTDRFKDTVPALTQDSYVIPSTPVPAIAKSFDPYDLLQPIPDIDVSIDYILTALEVDSEDPKYEVFDGC